MPAEMPNEADLGTIRHEARQWFAEHWDPAEPVGAWWSKLATSGWGFPDYPAQWFGRGISEEAARVVAEEIEAIGAYPPPWGIGTMMVGPLLLELGTEQQRRDWLAGILDGSTVWCQLFSEPDAGSDLANVKTAAVRDGDQWVVNGQKVWTSGAHYADMAVLIARTNPEASKNRGLTFFAIDMNQPGIETRPLVQMSGDAEFNEVFLTDAVVPVEHQIGELDGGWAVALRLLSYERNSLDPEADAGIQTEIDLTIPAGDYATGLADDGLRHFMPGDAEAWSILCEVLDETGANLDPVVRQEAMRVYCRQQTSRLSALRSGAEAATRADGSIAGPTGSLGKLAASHTMRAWRELSLRALGPHGQLAGADAPHDGTVQHVCLNIPGLSLAGGTDEIQRNIIGEQLLGLPREPRG